MRRRRVHPTIPQNTHPSVGRRAHGAIAAAYDPCDEPFTAASTNRPRHHPPHGSSGVRYNRARCAPIPVQTAPPRSHPPRSDVDRPSSVHWQAVRRPAQRVRPAPWHWKGAAPTDGRRAANATRARHLGADRRSRRACSSSRTPTWSCRSRSSRSSTGSRPGPTTSVAPPAPRCARSRNSGSSTAARWPHPVSDRQRHGHPPDRDQQHPSPSAHRARPRSGGARQPHHRRGDRPVRLRPDHDGQQRRRPAHQGRPPRGERRRTPAHASPTTTGRPSGGPRSTRHYEAIDCLYAAGAIAADAVLTSRRRRVEPARERVRRPALRLAVGARATRRRRVRPAAPGRCPRRGACGRGARNSASPSSCSSIPTSP